MNLLDEIDKIMDEGYNEANAEARLCQDILLKAISDSSLNKNVTIKGGVVMRNLSKSARRATQDVDLDFIRYSISDEFGNFIEGKIDIGVHKELDIEQEEYCFDICFQEDGASLLMNSKEQIITEKLKSLMRFLTRNTRYKDVFDIYYLKDSADTSKLIACIKKYIFEDPTLDVNNIDDIISRLQTIFSDNGYIKMINRSKKNWIGIDTIEVLNKDLEFFQSIKQ